MLFVVVLAVAAIRHFGGEGGRARTAAGGGGPTPVPWIDEPAPSPTPATTTTLVPVTSPPCKASDIRVVGIEDGAATGHASHEVRLRNSGKATCGLDGYPTIAAISDQGPLDDYSNGTFFPDPVPADIPRHAEGVVIFETSHGCEATLDRRGPVYHDVQILMPGGGYLAIPGLELDGVCGIGVSLLGQPSQAEASPPSPEPGSLASLDVTTTMPRRVRAGDVVRFEITLMNRTSLPVRLEPCPGYRIALYTVDKGSVDRTYALNCRGSGEIPAAGERAFAMVLRIPDAATGSAKFSWSMFDWGGPSTGAPVEVRRGQVL